MPLGLDFVNDLDPVAYVWKRGGTTVTTERAPAPEGRDGEQTVERHAPKAGTRTHYGLLAQDVKALLDRHGIDDFAGWTLADGDDPDSEQGLRYEQFVPILVRAVQELSDRVEHLRRAG